MPEISIIVPIFNVEEQLEACLKSIETQTFSDFEVIMIDDGSTDSSQIIASNYAQKDARFKLLTQNNMGVSCARNKGIENANGNYISMIDGDDEIVINYLEELHTFCLKNNLDFTFCNAYNIHGDKKSKILNDTPHTGAYSGGDLLHYLLPRKEFIYVVWWNLYKAEFLRRLNMKFVPGLSREDIPWTIKLMCESNRVGYLDKPLYIHNERQGSLTRPMTDKQRGEIAKDLMRVVDILAKYLSTAKVDSKIRHILSWLIADCGLGIYHNIEKLPWEYKIRLYKELTNRNIDKMVKLHSTTKKQKSRANRRSLRARLMSLIG